MLRRYRVKAAVSFVLAFGLLTSEVMANWTMVTPGTNQHFAKNAASISGTGTTDQNACGFTFEIDSGTTTVASTSGTSSGPGPFTWSGSCTKPVGSNWPVGNLTALVTGATGGSANASIVIDP